MRRLLYFSLFLVATTAAALSQPFPNYPRYGSNAGAAMTPPQGDRANSAAVQDMRTTVSPTLPLSPEDEGHPPSYFLQAAQNALAAGRTDETQQALEMAQTRLLDRSVPIGQTNNPSNDPLVRQTSQALQALAARDRGTCMQLIEAALGSASARGL